MICEGELGIHPPGALGVAFFLHADADVLIGRSGDGITQPLKDAGAFRVQEADRIRPISIKNKVFSNLLEADARNKVPELLFVCCNPNQLSLFTGELTRFLENLASRGRLSCEQDIRDAAPISVILPNGVLAEQTVQTYAEQLHESALIDRLPGVTEPMIQLLLDRIVRGISLQAGGRRGSGVDTIYLREAKGSILFAGGGEFERDRVETILVAHDYPYRRVRGASGTRIEFDKAMISIVLNVGGLIHTVEASGELVDLRMGDLCKDPSKAQFIQTVTRAVFDVGKAIGAYEEANTYEEMWAMHRATILRFAGHVTSSLKAFRDALSNGLDSVKLFSNEDWLLTPLGRYAANAGLTSEATLFKSLGRQIQQAMARAIKYRDQISGDHRSRGRTMKLSAQRNIGIDLFEVGADDFTVVGTLLDGDHLIKLEMDIHLPDEQITRSTLNMIRAPFPVCREVERVAERLVGLRIEQGVVGEIAKRVGGRVGCSHIKELATSIVYFVASYLVRRHTGIDPLKETYTTTPPEERFRLTKDLLRGSCLAYCQATSQALDERIGIRRLGEQHSCPVPLGDYEQSLGQLLRDRVKRFGDKVYLRYRIGERDFAKSWNDFAKTVSQIARHLIDLGVRNGDRICMISENRSEMFMFEMAVMSIGAVSVPVFAGYPAPQIAYVIRNARPRMVVVSGMHQLDKIDRQGHPGVKQYYCMDYDRDTEAWGAVDFAQLTGAGGASQDQLDARTDAVQGDDPCLVMYTSGTTGPPKGAQLCHRNLISQQKAISVLWDISEADVFLSYLPWHHSFGGLFERFMTLYNGCELCLDDSRGRDTDRLVANWRAFNPTLFFSVPRVHDMLLARCSEDADIASVVFGKRLRFVFTAGASLPAHVEAVYREHSIPVLEGWGLTETSPCVTVTTKEGEWRSGYVGFPIPGVSVRVDGDQEILVKGPNVMRGYLDDEEATSHVIDDDGWFHTGDLGEFTNDGLRIFGRKDGAFKLTTGEKVHPQRIENTLVNESPYINTALVVGSGKDFVGALIYPDFTQLRQWAAKRKVTGAHLTDSPEVRELYASELQRINPMIEVKYHRLKRAVLADRDPSLEKGELTPSSKIVRKRVSDSFKRELSALFEAHPPECVIQVLEPQLQGV